MHYISFVIYYILYIDAINNRMMHPKAHRAPELLLTGAMSGQRFTPPCEPVLTRGIDVWAMGCLFVRMSTGVSPFDELGTNNYVDVMREIVHRLGAPTRQQFIQWGAGCSHKLPVSHQRDSKKCPPWEIIGVHPELVPTLSQVLVYDLDARLSSSSAKTSLVGVSPPLNGV